ncbi:MAG: hypothetical protein HQ559_01655 [Lentisphaerae bacterium]|nr:hypothetical protein [Lentisphaerota bacterium]
MTKIEEMTDDQIRELVGATDDTEKLGELRLRCIQMFDKYFNGAANTRPPMTRGSLLTKYSIVAKRLHDLGKPVSAKSRIDQTLMRKGMLGVDVCSLEPITLIENAVSIYGAHAVNPRGAADVEVVVDKACELFSEQLKSVTSLLLAQLDKPVLMGHDDVEGSIIPLYDLVIVPCEKTRRVIKESATAADTSELTIAAKKAFDDVMIHSVEIMKDEDEERIVGGIVYEAEVVDAQDDFTDADEIKKTMFDFMENCQTFQCMHKTGRKNVTVLECFQADADTKKGGGKIKKGAWWLTVRVNDDKLWSDIKSGDLTGFSMGGKAEVAE